MSKQLTNWRDQLNQPNECDEAWSNIKTYLQQIKDKKKAAMFILDFICCQTNNLDIYPKILNELSNVFHEIESAGHIAHILRYFQKVYKTHPVHCTAIIPSFQIIKYKLKDDERNIYIQLNKYAGICLFQEKSYEDKNFRIIFDNFILLLKQSSLEQFWSLLEDMFKFNLIKNYNVFRPELYQEFVTKLVAIRSKEGVHPNYFWITNLTVYFFGDQIPIQSSVDASIRFFKIWKGTARIDDPAISDCFLILIQFLSVFNGSVKIEQFLKDFQIFIEKSCEGNLYSSDVYITLVKYFSRISSEISDFLTEQNFKSFLELSSLLFQKVRKATPSAKIFCTKCTSVIRHKVVTAVSSQLSLLEQGVSKEFKITDWKFLKEMKASIRYVFMIIKDWKCSNAIYFKNKFSCQVYKLLCILTDANDYLKNEKMSILEVLYKNQENVVNSHLNNDFTYLQVLSSWETSTDKKLICLVHIVILLDDPNDTQRENVLQRFLSNYANWVDDHDSIFKSLQEPGTIFHGVTIPNYCLKEILFSMLKYVMKTWPDCGHKLSYSIFDDLIKLETDPVKTAEYSLFLPIDSTKFIELNKTILGKLDSSENLHLGVLNYRVYLNEYRDLIKIGAKVVEDDNESLIKTVVELMEQENRLLTYLNNSLKNFKKFVNSFDKKKIKSIETKTAIDSMNEIGKHFHMRGFQQEAALAFGLLYDFSQQLNEQHGVLKSISFFSENFNTIPYFQHNFPNYDMKIIIKNYAETVFNNIETKTGQFKENLLCFMNIASFYMKHNEIKSAQVMMKYIKIKLKETYDGKDLNILEAIYSWMEISLQYSVEEIATHQANRLGRIFVGFISTISSVVSPVNDSSLVYNLLFKSVEEFSIYNQQMMNSEETPSPIIFMMFKFAVKQTFGMKAVMNLLLMVDIDLKMEICKHSVSRIELLLSMMKIQDNFSLKDFDSCKQQQPIDIGVHAVLETTRRDASQLFSNESFKSSPSVERADSLITNFIIRHKPTCKCDICSDILRSILIFSIGCNICRYYLQKNDLSTCLKFYEESYKYWNEIKNTFKNDLNSVYRLEFNSIVVGMLLDYVYILRKIRKNEEAVHILKSCLKIRRSFNLNKNVMILEQLKELKHNKNNPIDDTINLPSPDLVLLTKRRICLSSDSDEEENITVKVPETKFKLIVKSIKEASVEKQQNKVPEAKTKLIVKSTKEVLVEKQQNKVPETKTKPKSTKKVPAESVSKNIEAKSIEKMFEAFKELNTVPAKKVSKRVLPNNLPSSTIIVEEEVVPKAKIIPRKVPKKPVEILKEVEQVVPKAKVIPRKVEKKPVEVFKIFQDSNPADGLNNKAFSIPNNVASSTMIAEEALESSIDIVEDTPPELLNILPPRKTRNRRQVENLRLTRAARSKANK